MHTIIVDKATGFEYEIRGADNEGDHFIDLGGHIKVVGDEGVERVRLRLLKPRHVFGGVVFEETGEKRKAIRGEWVLDDHCDSPTPVPGSVYDEETFREFIILRPVALED